ncbi:hypothetical protein SLE2022_039230 [Rubroshorea leprosula]
MKERPSNMTSTSGDVTSSSGIESCTMHDSQQSIASSNQAAAAPPNRKSLPGNNPEVIALSPKTLLATNRFVCEICNKGFQREQNLQLHRRGHNLPWKLRQRTSKEVRKKVYVCPEPTCVHHDPLRAFADFTGVKRHFLRKHSEKKWKCEKCSKRYAVQSDWEAHSKTCGTREYRCDCGTIFTGRDSFITHRAFCDALADESARTITATNSLYAPAEPPASSSSLSHLERIFPVERELASLFVEKDSASFWSEASGPSTCTEQSNEVGAEGPSVSHRAIPKQEWKGNYSSKSAISYRLRQNALIHPGTISALSRLTELSIDVNSDDERWNAVVEAVTEEACSLETLKCLILYLPNIESLGKRRMGSTSLGYYPLHGFRFTIGQHKQRTISRVPKQVETHFQKWKRCLKFVKGKEIPSEMKKVLKCTKAFYLDRHDTATSLCDFGTENMQELEFCLLVECNEIQTIISGVESLEEQADVLVKDPNNSESGGGLLSAQEPALVNLQYLHIFYLKNLVSIWRTPTNDKQCLSGLKFLALHMCPKLSVIFSPAMLANLGKLELLIVKDCPEVTSVVSLTSNESTDRSLYLPSLKRILLLYLPKLLSISGGFRIAPNLEKAGFYNCPKLESLSRVEMSSGFLQVIRGESKWWEALKWNKSQWGTGFDYIQSIFSPVTTEKDVMTQMEEISRIPSSHQTRMRDSSYTWMESAGKRPLDSSFFASQDEVQPHPETSLPIRFAMPLE